MKQFITILILIVSFAAFGQESSNVKHGFTNYVVKIKSITCDLDSVLLQKINPKWISKIEILKYAEDKYIYGNRNGVVQIYPKQKFYQEIIPILAEHHKLNRNTKISKQIKKQDFVIKAGIGFDKYRLESTSLLQIISDFGLSYNLIENEENSICILEYKKLGLTFCFNDNNSNALLQGIEFRKPFQGITETGIRLNKSTMLNVKEVYGELDWYSINGSEYWWSEHPGIEFGVVRDSKLPQYPLDEELHEQKEIVEINVVSFDNK